MKRGKRFLLLTVCAVVAAAFALTGCGGEEAKGEQVTREQYEQIFTKMLEAFPNVPQKANAAMAAEDAELLNFIIRQKDRITMGANAEQELMQTDATLEVDNKKIKADVSMKDAMTGTEQQIVVSLYMAEISGECWMYYFQSGKWQRSKLSEMEQMPDAQAVSPIEAIQFQLTLLKNKFDLFEYRDEKYVCKAAEAPKMLARFQLSITDGAQVEELAKNYKNASLSLRFADGKLSEISLEGTVASPEFFEMGEMKSVSQIAFTDYGKAKVTLPSVA